MLWCAAALVAVVAAAPLGHLVLRVATADPERLASVILRPRTLDLLLTSVGVTTATSLGALAVGVATAWVLTRVALPWRGFWRVVVCLPLAVPSFVAAFAWMGVFPGLSGPGPLVGILVLSTAPYVTVPTMAAFARTDTAVVDAAVSLGRSPRHAFLTVTLPQVLPAALAGTLLVALYTLSDFGAPALLRVDTLTTGIYAQFTGGFDRSLAAAMALVLAGLAVVCVLVEAALRRRSSLRADVRAVPAPPRRLGRVGTMTALVALAAMAVVSVFLPPAALVARLPFAGRYFAEPGELVTAAVTTLGLGLTAAVVTVVAALPVAWLAARRPSATVSVLASLTYLGHAVPGLVVGLALVSLSLAVAPGAYQGPVILVAAYVVLFLPKAVGSARAAFAGVAPGLYDAARSLGDSPLRVWRRVTLPLAAPGILAGGVLVMAAVMKELPATLLLRPIGVHTLATELWSATSLGAYGAAALPALMLILVGLVPALAVARGIRSIGEDPR